MEMHLCAGTFSASPAETHERRRTKIVTMRPSNVPSLSTPDISEGPVLRKKPKQDNMNPPGYLSRQHLEEQRARDMDVPIESDNDLPTREEGFVSGRAGDDLLLMHEVARRNRTDGYRSLLQDSSTFVKRVFPGRNRVHSLLYQRYDAPEGRLGAEHSKMLHCQRQQKDKGKFKGKEKVNVEMRVVFLKIGEIDTLKEQYSADAFIQAKWREPLLDGKSSEELKEVDLSKYWNPLLYIDNILSEQKDTSWVTASLNARGDAYILERRRVKAIFLENLELEHFPMDVQDLTITVTTERSDSEVDIIPDESELSGINIQTFVDQQEWRLHEHIEVTKKAMSQEYSSSNRTQPALSITCRAARRPGYFYWNVYLIMFMISSLSFATFSVAPTLPQNRLQLTFTLFLTSVAFKFVINQSLPKISYLTYMDKYVLMSLFVICCICIWHSVVAVLGDIEQKYNIERYVGIAMVIAYVISHLIFGLILYFGAFKRRRLMKEKDEEYKDFLAKKLKWQEKGKEVAKSAGDKSSLIIHSVQMV